MGGGDKLMEPVDGQPLIADRVRVALRAGLPVVVALPPQADAPERWAALDGAPVRRVAVPDHASGLSASLRAGIAALPPETAGALVMLADMPEITVGDLAALLDGWDGTAIHRAASARGEPGNPVLFPASDFPGLCALTGDIGARALLRAEGDRVRLVPLPEAHALTDLDTAEDWARWRASR